MIPRRPVFAFKALNWGGARDGNGSGFTVLSQPEGLRLASGLVRVRNRPFGIAAVTLYSLSMQATDEKQVPSGSGKSNWVAGLGALALALVFIACGTWVRVHFALADSEFDVQTPDGMLRSDPGLLYYLTERIVEAGGTPENFGEEPNIRYPETADVPAMFTVGQEYLVAWAYGWFGGDTPLHVFALKFMALVAALAAGGVFGLAYELARGGPGEENASPWRALPWGCFAAALYLVQPFSYRTLGVILIREDLSLPLYMGHLWLLARTMRTDGRVSLLVSAVCLSGALATWHAMGFVVALELVVLTGWFLRTGESPFQRRRFAVLPLVVAVTCVLVPVLRAKLFLFAPAMLLAAGLLVAGQLSDRAILKGLGKRARAWALFGAGVLGLALLGGLTRLLMGGTGDYGHVFSFLVAKLSNLGGLPQDPSELDFGARLLWQGPFSTASFADFQLGLGSASALAVGVVVLAIPGWLRGTGDRRFLLLAGLVAASLGAGWMVRRTMVLVALLAPAAAAAFFARTGKRGLGFGVLGVALVGQLWFGFEIAKFHRVDWYHDARFEPIKGKDARNVETRRLVRWVGKNLRPQEPVLTDFVYSTSLLAGAGTPMVLQPKYETAESRDRIERFLTTFHQGSPEDMGKLMQEWKTRVLMIAPWDMMTSHAYAAGVQTGKAPEAGTGAATFCHSDPKVFSKIPGYRLIYVSQSQDRGVHQFRMWWRK